MRRYIFTIIVILLLIPILSCCRTNSKSNENYAKKIALDMKQDFPIIDGSTSLIPLDVGIHKAIFELTLEEAEKKVVHSKSWQAFDNLIKDNCDVLLSVPLSEAQNETAQNMNIELELIPIAYEGFIFLLNKDNPVNSLTTQQIKDIYAGKITNWKEVGGDDAEIIPYQRNKDSGSQNYMIEFMGDTKLMEAPGYLQIFTMFGLIEQVSVYDNSKYAIGYSVYTYAADMYEGTNNIKFLAVDNIVPSKKTIADKSYPIISYNYAIIKKSAPQGSAARNLAEWLVTDAGQRTVAESGYIPLENAKKSQIQEVTKADLYTSKGTGKAKVTATDNTYDYYYTASILETDTGRLSVSKSKFEKDSYDRLSFYQGVYKITALKDPKLVKELEDFIYTSIEELTSEEVQIENQKILEKISPLGYRSKIVVEEVCKNGYYSLVVRSSYIDHDSMITNTKRFFDCRTVVYDLYTGEKLELSDLFYKDVDFIVDLNNGLSSSTLDADSTETIALQNPLYGFTLNEIYFPIGNEYFSNAAAVPISGVDKFFAVLEPRDMKGIFENDAHSIRNLTS